MKNLILIVLMFIASSEVFAFQGKFLSIGVNPGAQRLSSPFGSSQDVLGTGGEVEFGNRMGGFELSTIISSGAGEGKNFTKNLEGINYTFKGTTTYLSAGMRIKYRFQNNFYLFMTPQLKSVFIEDDGKSEPEDDELTVSGQLYELEEIYLGYGTDVGFGYGQSLNNDFVEDIYYQLSYSINNYSKNYGEYMNGEDRRKINRSVGSNYYDQSILFTVGVSFSNSILHQGKRAFNSIKSHF